MSNYNNLLLNRQLCFLLYASSNAITRLFNQKLSKLELAYPQLLVLFTLWEVDGLAVKKFSHKLKLTSGTTTPILSEPGFEVLHGKLNSLPRDDGSLVIKKQTLRSEL
tara:strand:- start:393 stop:716 length:324 start_codon:yes stop_codon:yes gene_type:complete